MLELQPARLGQRPTLLNTQGPIRLRHACQVTVVAQRAVAASQPAGWYRPTVYGSTDRPEVTAAKCRPKCTHLWKNVIIFVTTTPKPSNVLQMASTRVRAKFRRRTTRRLGGDKAPDKINKLSNI